MNNNNKMKAEVELRKIQKPRLTKKTISVTIPPRFSAVLGLGKGDYAKMTLRNKTIIIEKYIFKQGS